MKRYLTTINIINVLLSTLVIFALLVASSFSLASKAQGHKMISDHFEDYLAGRAVIDLVVIVSAAVMLILMNIALKFFLKKRELQIKKIILTEVLVFVVFAGLFITIAVLSA